MKVLRMVLSRQQVVDALGNYVAQQHQLPPQRAHAEAFIVYDVFSPTDIQIKQARVEVTLPDASD